MESFEPKKPASPAEPSDEVLVERVVRQDVAAFSLLYDRYAHTVYALAVHIIGHVDAEEVVQEVFLRLWKKAGQFEAARGSFKSWFMTVARNYVLDELKRRNRERRLLVAQEIDHLITETADLDVDLADDASFRERRRVLLNALKRLPAEQRQAIILAYFGGLSQSSIAQHTDWPLGTVKKRIRLGLQKLRAAFFLWQTVGESPDGSAPAGEE